MLGARLGFLPRSSLFGTKAARRLCLHLIDPLASGRHGLSSPLRHVGPDTAYGSLDRLAHPC